MNKSQHSVFFIMGVSGAGKSTIGVQLAAKLKIPFFDGDDFHPEANRKKMAVGIPLNDDDRLGWLKTLNLLVRKEVGGHSIVIACSALKESYRQLLMSGIADQCQWFLLEGSYDQIMDRMSKRKEHYMPTSLLQSQFDLLEVPPYAITISLLDSPEEMVALILESIAKNEK